MYLRIKKSILKKEEISLFTIKLLFFQSGELKNQAWNECPWAKTLHLDPKAKKWITSKEKRCLVLIFCESNEKLNRKGKCYLKTTPAYDNEPLIESKTKKTISIRRNVTPILTLPTHMWKKTENWYNLTRHITRFHFFSTKTEIWIKEAPKRERESVHF